MRIEVSQGRRDLMRGEARIERDEDGAELEEGVCEGREGGAVAEGDGDAVALADAELGEGGGEAVGQEVEV